MQRNVGGTSRQLGGRLMPADQFAGEGRRDGSFCAPGQNIFPGGTASDVKICIHGAPVTCIGGTQFRIYWRPVTTLCSVAAS